MPRHSKEPCCPSCGLPFADHVGVIVTCWNLQITRLQLLEARVDRAELRAHRAFRLLVSLCVLPDNVEPTTKNICAALMKLRREKVKRRK